MAMILLTKYLYSEIQSCRLMHGSLNSATSTFAEDVKELTANSDREYDKVAWIKINSLSLLIIDDSELVDCDPLFYESYSASVSTTRRDKHEYKS